MPERNPVSDACGRHRVLPLWSPARNIRQREGVRALPRPAFRPHRGSHARKPRARVRTVPGSSGSRPRREPWAACIAHSFLWRFPCWRRCLFLPGELWAARPDGQKTTGPWKPSRPVVQPPRRPRRTRSIQAHGRLRSGIFPIASLISSTSSGCASRWGPGLARPCASRTMRRSTQAASTRPTSGCPGPGTPMRGPPSWDSKTSADW